MVYDVRDTCVSPYAEIDHHSQSWENKNMVGSLLFSGRLQKQNRNRRSEHSLPQSLGMPLCSKASQAHTDMYKYTLYTHSKTERKFQKIYIQSNA